MHTAGTYSPFATKGLKDEGAICLCYKKRMEREKKEARLWCNTHIRIFYGGIPNVRDVVRDRSKGLEHAKRAKKRRTREQNVVGVDGSETRNTGHFLPLFSLAARTRLEV